MLRRLVPAYRRLAAELKGVARTIPNEQTLINTLTLQEAGDSSAIENIITTHDKLSKAELFIESSISPVPSFKLGRERNLFFRTGDGRRH